MIKKNNKNGFTLIELLVTIGIIGIIFGITTYVGGQLINNSNKKTVYVTNQNIRKAVNLYAIEYPIEIIWNKVETDEEDEPPLEQGCVLITELINKGFLSQKELSKTNVSIEDSILLTRDSNKNIINEQIDNNICQKIGKKVPIPSSKELCNNNLVYNTNEQTLTNETNYNRFNLLNYKATNADVHNVILELKNGYVWSDDTTSNKEISCTIKKATPTINLDYSIINSSKFNAGDVIENKVTTNIEGIITAKSSNEEYVGIEVINKNTTPTTKGQVNIKLLSTRSTNSYITITITPTGDYKKNYHSISTTVYIDDIDRTRVIIPTSTEFCNDSLTYNGSSQNLLKKSLEGVTFDKTKATNAGKYTITAKLSYGYIWTDNTFENKTFECNIAKKTPTITLSPTSGIVFTGTTTTTKVTPETKGTIAATSQNTSYATVSPSSTNVTSSSPATITIKGIKATNSVNTTIKFTPTDTTNYNTNTTTYALKVYNKATIPTSSAYCKSGLVYNGSNQTLTNTAPTGVTFSGNVGKNATSYTVSATLSTNYMWSDGTTGTKTFTCSITKKTPTLTLSPTSGTVMKTKSITTKATPNVSGKISVKSANTSYATASATTTTVSSSSPGTVTIKGVNVTNAVNVTVTLTPTDTTNYNTKTATYTLKVTTNQFTLTYNNNGGSGCSTKTITNGSTYGTLCTPTRSGYTFIGWYSSSYLGKPLNYYADTYSDLKNAYGYDANNLYSHYLNYGKSENRRIAQYLSTDTVTATSNITVYAGWVKGWYSRRTRTWYNCLYTECVGAYKTRPDDCFPEDQKSCVGAGKYWSGRHCCYKGGTYWDSCASTRCVSGYGSWSSWSGYSYASCSGSGSVQCSGPVYSQY